MNFKLFIFVIVSLLIKSSTAFEFEAKFLNVQDDFVSINNLLDNEDGEDIALKNIKELNFDAHKTVKLAGEDYKESNCEGSKNLCKLYQANLVKCVNVNYQTDSDPAFKCSIVDADNADEDLEITNALIRCNNPKNKLPGYIRTPCIFTYQFKFKEDGKDFLLDDIKILNFDASRTVKSGRRETKQTECDDDKNLCRTVNVQLIKCKVDNRIPECEIKSAVGRKDSFEIGNPWIRCNNSPFETHYVRPPCIIRYKLKVKN